MFVDVYLDAKTKINARKWLLYHSRLQLLWKEEGSVLGKGCVKVSGVVGNVFSLGLGGGYRVIAL